MMLVDGDSTFARPTACWKSSQVVNNNEEYLLAQKPSACATIPILHIRGWMPGGGGCNGLDIRISVNMEFPVLVPTSYLPLAQLHKYSEQIHNNVTLHSVWVRGECKPVCIKSAVNWRKIRRNGMCDINLGRLISTCS